MPKILDLIGERYGKLTVIEYSGKTKNNKTKWICLCDCGAEVEVQTALLRNGKTQSCGCIKSDMLVKRNTTHGKAKTPEHQAWLSAKARTTNPNFTQSKDYMGRGIVMEDPWFSSFEVFLGDMGLKPTPKHSIERLDVDGNYCKSNCIWATPETQAFNQRKRNTNTSGRTGVSWHKGKGKWETSICVDRKKIYLGSYIDFELACFIRTEAELHYHGFTKE